MSSKYRAAGLSDRRRARVSSLTWQELPPDLLEPVMAGVLLLHQAAEIFDLMLTAPLEWTEVDLPPHLEAVGERLWLWRLEVDPTRH